MTAPEELSRKENTVVGEIAAMITARNPTTDEARMAMTGTPRELTDTIDAGASRRAARTKSIREAV